METEKRKFNELTEDDKKNLTSFENIEFDEKLDTLYLYNYANLTSFKGIEKIAQNITSLSIWNCPQLEELLDCFPKIETLYIYDDSIKVPLNLLQKIENNNGKITSQTLVYEDDANVTTNQEELKKAQEEIEIRKTYEENSWLNNGVDLDIKFSNNTKTNNAHQIQNNSKLHQIEITRKIENLWFGDYRKNFSDVDVIKIYTKFQNNYDIFIKHDNGSCKQLTSIDQFKYNSTNNFHCGFLSNFSLFSQNNITNIVLKERIKI